MLDKIIACIGYAGQNLFLASVMFNKTYSGHRLCRTKPIPGIYSAEQNLIWDSVVKICKTGCFPSKNSIFEIE